MGEPAGNQAETSHVSARSLSNGTICMDYSDELTAPTTGSFLTESAVSCLANTVASKCLMFGQAIHTGTGKKKSFTTKPDCKTAVVRDMFQVRSIYNACH